MSNFDLNYEKKKALFRQFSSSPPLYSSSGCKGSGDGILMAPTPSATFISPSPCSSSSSMAAPPTSMFFQEGTCLRAQNADEITEAMMRVEFNTRLQLRSWHDVFIRTTRIVFQFSAVAFFILNYYVFQSKDWINSETMLQTIWALCIFGHVYYTAWINYSVLGFNWESVGRFFPLVKIQISICFVVFAGQFAPIIRSLAATVSTDSIHAGTLLLVFIHLLTADYGTDGFFKSRTVSMNSGMFGAICLSSRLKTTQDSLALLTLAVFLFLLFPTFTQVLWDSPFWLVVCITFVSVSCLTISTDFFLIYISVVFFIILIIPLIYIRYQECKKNLHGPWDEAVIKPSNESIAISSDDDDDEEDLAHADKLTDK